MHPLLYTFIESSVSGIGFGAGNVLGTNITNGLMHGISRMFVPVEPKVQKTKPKPLPISPEQEPSTEENE